MPIVSFTSSRGFCDEKTKKVHKNNRSEWTTDKDTIQKEETRPKGRTAFCAKHSFISPFFVSLQFRCMLCFFFFFLFYLVPFISFPLLISFLLVGMADVVFQRMQVFLVALLLFVHPGI